MRIRNRRRLALAVPLLGGVLAAIVAVANPEPAGSAMEHHHHDAMGHDEHAMHQAMMANSHYERLQATYDVPPLVLTNTHGEQVRLDEVLGDDTPVVLNFIFTTCTTICPILSATFQQARGQLGEAADAARWVSITIDPEHDTPQVLERYARQFKATANWEFLTGDPETIVAAQRAFGAYRGDKMSHEAVTFLRSAGGTRWVRLEGLTSGSELAREYQHLQHP